MFEEQQATSNDLPEIASIVLIPNEDEQAGSEGDSDDDETVFFFSIKIVYYLFLFYSIGPLPGGRSKQGTRGYRPPVGGFFCL
jgi:hypothetical protein